MGHHPKKSDSEKQSSKQRLNAKRKTAKKFRTEKKARLVVKNLPFQTTEEQLRDHYQKYGDVVEVQLLKRPDGKLVGCGFIQYKEVQKAAKARFHTNDKPFLGRTIQCDWALAKNKFIEKRDKLKAKEDVEIKDEPSDADVIKEEPIDETLDTSCNTVKSEEDVKGEEGSENDEGASEDDIESLKEEDENESEASDEDEKEGKLEDSKDFEERPKVVSNDVSEGRTIFIKNIPFSATNGDLKECMLQYGRVFYALICMDKFTEHSKGTGFVKFVNSEDAEKCLQAGTELTLLGNILDCHKALNRNEIGNKDSKKEERRDARNLYLVKEGVVLAGTKAADGVSASDMTKRLQIEQYKTQMLRNLNMYVSKNRLVVHNLPPAWDDAKLRQLLQKHAGPKAFIREAKIMRNMKNLDSSGVGTSKEFGFVTFTTHEHALTALRSLNNNPNIFSETKRPIVAFSIENKSMIKAKEKRMQNSRIKNPKSKTYDPKSKTYDPKSKPFDPKNKAFGPKSKTLDPKTKLGDKTTQPESSEPKTSTVKKNNRRKNKRKRLAEASEDDQAKKAKMETKEVEFAGVEAKPGVSKMRSRYNLKTQAELHHQHLKNKKKKQKFAKKTLQQRKQDFIRQPSQKIVKKSESDSFSKLVNSYKSKLMAAPASSKQKWYEAT